MAKKKASKPRQTRRPVRAVVLTLAEKLAKELLAVGNEKGFQPCHRIEFKVYREGESREFEAGGLCEAALVRFFQSRVPVEMR